jgi:hypothetical protein
VRPVQQLQQHVLPRMHGDGDGDLLRDA